MRFGFGLLGCIALWTGWSGSLASALPDPGSGEESAAVSETKTEIGYADAVVLGLVEGVTEYLPISSTGHLILFNEVLGLNVDTPLEGRNGQPLWLEEPSAENPGGLPFTMKDAADAYAIIIQAGAIAAVLILFWRRVLSVLRGFLGRDRDGLLLGRNLILAFLPAVVFGLLFEDLIDRYLFGPVPVVAALIGGALLMMGVEIRRRRKRGVQPGPDLHDLSCVQALTIGLLQCVAMWPGTSRSMMTIVGGYLVGLTPLRSAEFSFLLGLITLTAASAYKALKTGPYLVEALRAGPLLVGCVVAALSAAVAVKWMIGYLTRHGLGIFAVYRLVLAGAVLVFLVW
ncbi:MAG TPA: undecaprenyl-diphosphate phosphatase [Verrucomicrobiales bacterium]|nr:undecaprenyl-diphosphate phosphatase [Verrucomicrobiales bacterium]